MIELYHDNLEDKIKVLFTTVHLIRDLRDIPQVWKFNIDYLDVLCEYMHIISHERLLKEKFLDASIDYTTQSPGCVGKLCFYPLIK